jgi:hypothetical protein
MSDASAAEVTAAGVSGLMARFTPERALTAGVSVLRGLIERFTPEHALWPQLPQDWDAIKDAGPGTPEDARVEALMTACAAARAELNAELLQPELVLIVSRLRIQDPYMTMLWILIKGNLPVKLFQPENAIKARAAIIKSTAVSIPNAFRAFLVALKNAAATPPPPNPF